MDPDSDEIYAIRPTLETGNPGLLSRAALNDINHVTNTLRYSLGLPEVAISQEKSHYAQAAAVINSLNGGLDHHPKVPRGMSEDDQLYKDGYKGASESNLHMGTNMLRQINSFTKDASKKNWDKVGHRKWLISPFVDTFGYGFYDRYGAAYVFSDGWPDTELEVVAYPSNVGLTEFFNDKTPFSFSVTEAFDISNVTIKMTELKTGKVMEYKTGKNIYVTNTQYKYGYMDNLSWGLGFKGEHGDQYEIEIDGIKLNGLDYPVNYTVNFISLEHANK